MTDPTSYTPYSRQLSAPKKTLAQRTIELIRTEGQFDMAFWSEGNDPLVHAPKCGAACCIAGNMTIAALELGFRPEPKEQVPDFAQRAWREQYGRTAGNLLDFYNDHAFDYDEDCREVGGFAHDEDGCRKALEDVTPEEAVAHVLSTLPPGAL